MTYFPYEHIVYKTKLSLDEINLLLLRRYYYYLDEDRFAEICQNPDSNKLIRNNKFSFYLSQKYGEKLFFVRNNFPTLINGSLKIIDGYSLIEIKMKLDWFSFSFLVLWLSCIFFALFLSYDYEEDFFINILLYISAIIIGSPIIIFPYLLITSSFQSVSKPLLEELEDLLEAEIIEQK